MDSDGRSVMVLRVRHRLAENVTLAVVICLLLAFAGGFVAYEESTAPDTRTEQRVVATWSTDGQFTHQATVQRSTRAFDEGAVLQDRAAYLFEITPELNATYVYQHSGDAGSATVSTNATLVKRSVDPSTGSQTEYWRVTDPLADRETTLSPGERVQTSFEIDVTEQRNQSRQIESELGGTPGQVQLYVLVTTQVATTVAGEPRQRTRTGRLELEPIGSTYAVTANTTGERTEEVTEAASVPIESNPLRIYGGALFGLLWLGIAAGTVRADRRGQLALPAADAAAIDARRTRDSFDEWISRGTVPVPSEEDALVDVASLEGLVDIAIDSDRRVIEDTETDRFVVIVDRTWYVYELPEDGPVESSSRDGNSGPDGDAMPVDAGDQREQATNEGVPEADGSQLPFGDAGTETSDE